MYIVLSTCIIIITVMIIFLSLEFIDTLKHIKNASIAIEKLAKDADSRVTEVEPVFKIVNSLSLGVNKLFSNILEKISSIFR